MARQRGKLWWKTPWDPPVSLSLPFVSSPVFVAPSPPLPPIFSTARPAPPRGRPPRHRPAADAKSVPNYGNYLYESSDVQSPTRKCIEFLLYRTRSNILKSFLGVNTIHGIKGTLKEGCEDIQFHRQHTHHILRSRSARSQVAGRSRRTHRLRSYRYHPFRLFSL